MSALDYYQTVSQYQLFTEEEVIITKPSTLHIGGKMLTMLLYDYITAHLNSNNALFYKMYLKLRSISKLKLKYKKKCTKVLHLFCLHIFFYKCQ